MLFKIIFKKFWNIVRRSIEFIGIIFDAQQAITIFGGSGMTGVGSALWDKIPIVFPIAFILIGLGLVIYGIIRTIIKYRCWQEIKNNPEINELMQTHLDYYYCIQEIRDKVEKLNTKKIVNSQTKNEIARQYYLSLGISDELYHQYADMSVNPENYTKHELKKAQKQLQKSIRYDPNDHFSAIFVLNGLGTILNRANLGLKAEMGNSDKYKILTEKLHQQQLSLDIPEEKIELVDNLKSLTDGVFCLSIAMRLINPGRTWYKKLPQKIVDYREQVDNDNKKGLIQLLCM